MQKRQKSRQTKNIYTIGIDLGGTKVATALVDHTGKPHAEARRATVPSDLAHLNPRNLTPNPSAKDVRKHIQYVIDSIVSAVEEVASHAPRNAVIGGIGLASAGPMNIERGTLNHPSNLIGWKVVPIIDLLTKRLQQKKIHAPLGFQNDAIAAALGEGWTGRAAECQTYAMITVGTGIGTGVILNGRPAQSRGMGSEWGHVLARTEGLLDDRNNFYERTIEGLASGTGLIRQARKLGFNGGMHDLARAAEDRDAMALQLFRGAAEALAAIFFNLSIGFHPEIIVISGGMLEIRKYFLPEASALYRDLMREHYPDFITPIKIAKLSTRAGVIGAARLPHLRLNLRPNLRKEASQP